MPELLRHKKKKAADERPFQNFCFDYCAEAVKSN